MNNGKQILRCIRASKVVRLSHVLFSVVIPNSSFSERDIAALGEAFFPLVPHIVRLIEKQYFEKTNIVDVFHGEHVIMLAAELGYRKLLNWIINNYWAQYANSFRIIDIPSEIKNAFNVALSAGHGGIAEFLASRFQMVSNNGQLQDMLFSCTQKACYQGNMNVVRWIFAKFKTEGTQKLFSGTSAVSLLEACCEKGHISIAKFLVKELQISIEDIRSTEHIHLLETTCAHGQVQVSNWLKEKFGLNQEDIGDAFTMACKNGFVDAAIWAGLHFGLPGRDRIVSSFVDTCGNGKLQAAQWMADLANISLIDSDSNGISLPEVALFKSCVCVHFLTTSWLINRFGLDYSFAKEALQKCCETGKDSMVKWLIERFQLTLADIREAELLHKCCFTKNLELIQWLLQHFRFELVDIQHALAFCTDAVVAQWLLCLFSPSQEDILHIITSDDAALLSSASQAVLGNLVLSF